MGQGASGTQHPSTEHGVGGRNERRGGKRELESGVGGHRARGEKSEGQKIEQRCIELGVGELGEQVAIRKSQMPGMQEDSKTQLG